MPWISGGDGSAESDSGSGDGGGTGAGSSDGGSGDSGGGDAGDKDDKPTLTQKQVNDIVARETAKAQRGKLDPKELGFESGKELKDFLDKQKEAADAAKDQATKDLEAAKEQATKNAEATVLSKANERITKSEFVVKAAAAGVTSPADAYVIAKTMSIWTQVELVEDGDDVKVNGFDDAFFEEMKKEKSFLFATADGQSGGKDLGGGAGNSDKGGKDRLSEENLLKNYSALRNR
jgi:F0F1-type ATP synthase membrane subunit b/b'